MTKFDFLYIFVFLLAGVAWALLNVFVPESFAQVVKESQLLFHFVPAFLVFASVFSCFVLLRKTMPRRYEFLSGLLSNLSPIAALLASFAYLVLRYAPEYQLTLSILVSVVVIACGWVIQEKFSHDREKKRYSLDIIFQTRTNEYYQQHVNNYGSAIGPNKHLSRDIAKKFIDNTLSKAVNSRYERQLEVVSSLMFVLNYFESMANGIEKNLLDDDILKDFFLGMASNVEKKGFYLILEAQQRDRRYYSALTNMVERWSGNSVVLTYKKGYTDEANYMLGTETTL